LPLFSAKKNPKLMPVLADEIKVYRDVYLSVHEDLEFLARVRLVIRHLVDAFVRDHDFLHKL
jgi:hypothetical protein